MTPETLSSTAAILLSLLFSYVPGFSDWYQRLPADLKRLAMLALLVLVSAASFGLACTGLPELGLAIACDTSGFLGLLKAFIAALIANQAAYALSPRKANAAPRPG